MRLIHRASRNHALKAEALVLAIQEGRLSTRAQWVRWTEELHGLPGGLKLWTIGKVRPFIGDDGISYILQWPARGVPA
jgi:hypothetical protein